MSSTSTLKKLALKLSTEGPVKTLPTPRKVQILYNGTYILRTTSAVFVWEHPYYPQYYLPKTALLSSAKKNNFTFSEDEPIKSEDTGDVVANICTLRVGNKSTSNVLAFADNLKGKAESLAGMVKIDFGTMDQWFEEETPIYVHPKDPFKRVDILSSARPIKISVAGHVVASTTTSMHLYETGLPVRYYLPLTSLDASVLRPSETRTKCPYKGEAEYLNVEVGGETHEDLFWFYTNPTLECAPVRGLVCPYSERVDIELDGEKLERPQTIFKKPREMVMPSAV